MTRLRFLLIWGALIVAVSVPIIAAAASPLLAWRQPIYILGGFAGVVAMALLLVQPLLAGDYLPGLALHQRRRLHRLSGALLVTAIVVHVGALWITSPPDVIDALLLVSPTPFSDWGVLAMWTCFATALLVAYRRRLAIRWHRWRQTHAILVSVTVTGSVAHALLIEGTMEALSKSALCLLVVIATASAFIKLRIWEGPKRRAN